MTTTDVDDTPADHEDEIRRGEPAPSALYDGATDPAEIDAIFKTEFAKAAEEYGGMFKVPGSIIRELQEDSRRAHIRRLVRVGARRGAATPRETIQAEARPVEHEDGSLTIVCGRCNTEKPVNKFPTLKGGNGRRGTVCRDCEAAIRAERKSGGKA